MPYYVARWLHYVSVSSYVQLSVMYSCPMDGLITMSLGLIRLVVILTFSPNETRYKYFHHFRYCMNLDGHFDMFHFLFAAISDASIDTEETQPCDPSLSQPPSNSSPSQEALSHPSSSQAPIHPVQAPGTLPPLPPTFSPITHNWGSGHTMMEGAEGAVQEEGEGDDHIQGVYPIQGV